jgi:hypothetical protein
MREIYMGINYVFGSSVFWVVDKNDANLALFIRNDFKSEGLSFLTPDESIFQIGAMTRPKDEYIQAHVHEPLQRQIVGTHEVLFLQEGSIRVDLFDETKHYVASVEMNSGDVVLLCSGGHGIEIIDEARIIEVKQGPFVNGLDKTKFVHEMPAEIHSHKRT